MDCYITKDWSTSKYKLHITPWEPVPLCTGEWSSCKSVDLDDLFEVYPDLMEACKTVHSDELVKTTSKTSDTNMMFNYGVHGTMYFTAIPVDEYITIETLPESDGKLTVNVRSSEEWGAVKKSYIGIHRIFMSLESLNVYIDKFNKYYKQDNKILKI